MTDNQPIKPLDRNSVLVDVWFLEKKLSSDKGSRSTPHTWSRWSLVGPGLVSSGPVVSMRSRQRRDGQSAGRVNRVSS